MSIRLRLLLIAVLLTFISGSGCNPFAPMLVKWRTPEAYIPPAGVAEVRVPTVVPVWIHDKKTGEIRKAYYNAYAGSLVGPGVPPFKESEVK